MQFVNLGNIIFAFVNFKNITIYIPDFLQNVLLLFFLILNWVATKQALRMLHQEFMFFF